MTLAAIILLVILGSAPFAASGHQSLSGSDGSTPALQTPTSQGQGQSQDQPAPAQTTPAQATPPPVQPEPSKKSASDQKPRSGLGQNHAKKKMPPSNCDPAAAKSASPSPAGSNAAAGNAHSARNSGATPANCPPKKTIVRQGGTSEPSIELAGAASDDQAAQQRSAVNQMVVVAEKNLKSIAAQEMTASQKDQVNQIQQYVAESKSAVADGDLDRARTLAWKAQMLSEDLVKPGK